MWTILIILFLSKEYVVSQSDPNFIPHPYAKSHRSVPLSYTSQSLHFAISLKVGSDPQIVPLILDTGSSELFLFTKSQCNSNTSCFDPSISSTLDPMGNSNFAEFSMEIDGSIVFAAGSIVSDLIESSEWKRQSYFGLAKERLIGSSDFQNFDDVAGVFGVSMNGNAYFSCINNRNSVCTVFDQLFLGSTPQIFAIDPSRMKMDIRGVVHENLIAAEATNAYDLFRAQLFDFSLCGISLFGGITSIWPAIIDTGSSCLSLPSEFFKSLLAHVPIECTGNVCIVPNEWIGRLPSLSFRLSKGGKRLFIPLDSLVIPDRSDGRICIVESTGILAPDHYALFTKSIVFGTLVLSTLYTVFDKSTSQVSFKSYSNDTSTEACITPPICSPDRDLDIHSNTCVPNQCSKYWFHVHSNVSNQCELSVYVLSCLLICLSIFTVFQVLLSHKRNQMVLQSLVNSRRV